MNRNLAAYRRALNISQSDMAKVAGLKLTSYNLKENDKSSFNQDQMFKIINFFKSKGYEVSADELFFSKDSFDVKLK